MELLEDYLQNKHVLSTGFEGYDVLKTALFQLIRCCKAIDFMIYAFLLELGLICFFKVDCVRDN